MLTVGSLFSGIGGFDLGLERAGMKVIWQSEIDPYARAVLKKHWPHVPNHGDIRTIRAESVERPDVLCGGFPCQDISNAGKRAGIDGERSGLWSEYARLIGEIRPRYVIVENVAALLGRGLERVLGDLAALGFDAEWHCIPASAVGAPHLRDRVWIVANARCVGDESRRAGGKCACKACAMQREVGQQWIRLAPTDCREDVADTCESRLERWTDDIRPQEEWRGYAGHIGASLGGNGRNDQWTTEPDVGRVANGIPARVDRLRCLGNAIVPQIAEIIGRAISAIEDEQ